MPGSGQASQPAFPRAVPLGIGAVMYDPVLRPSRHVRSGDVCMPPETGELKPALVAIACQGGGSHAAFAAGVVHRLLEDHGSKLRLSALTGTSGGAINAVLAWSGLIQGGEENGPAEAQRRLRSLWEDLGATKPLDVARNCGVGP